MENFQLSAYRNIPFDCMEPSQAKITFQIREVRKISATHFFQNHEYIVCVS